MKKYIKEAKVKKKIGLCLGSGGAKGLAHIGVIKYLEENNYEVEFIAGSSIGALIGGAYASGLNINEIEKIALEINLLSTAKLLSPGIRKSGFVSGTKIYDFINSKFNDQKIENLKIPFISVATNIFSGQEVHFNKGNLSEAIRASISIPIVFKPFVINDIVLVDGGLVNPVPIDVVREMGSNFIVAVNVMSAKPHIGIKPHKSLNTNNVSAKYHDILQILDKKLEELIIDHKWIKSFIKHKEKEDLPSIKKIFNKSVTITQQKLIELSIKLNKPEILIEPEVNNFSLFDFYKAKEIIQKGYEATEFLLK